VLCPVQKSYFDGAPTQGKLSNQDWKKNGKRGGIQRKGGGEDLALSDKAIPFKQPPNSEKEVEE